MVRSARREGAKKRGLWSWHGACRLRRRGVLDDDACDVRAMPGVPFRAGAAHIMTLGTVGVASAFDQAVASRHDRIEAAEQRQEGWSRRQHGNPLSAAFRG